MYNGNCMEVMKTIPDNSVDSIVTDPPYELGFMGKSWDSTGIANNVDMWSECLRVLKPGGYLLSFSATRTYHRMASAIEDAGFEIRDFITWAYGSGFPKSLNISKAIEKKEGLIESSTETLFNNPKGKRDLSKRSDYGFKYTPTNEDAKKWDGWGTALKPSIEPICMARKPLSEKTVAENCLKWGTGGINIDKSRVEYQSDSDKSSAIPQGRITTKVGEFAGRVQGGGTDKELDKDEWLNKMNGRFPANLIHDGSDEVMACFPETKSGGTNGKKAGNKNCWLGVDKEYNMNELAPNSGNAARYFKSIIYQTKASKSERNEDINNFHPTVKPVKLMEYLIEMVTPENGTVLDPFMGSGTTGLAAKNLNRKFIGIELEEDYFELAKSRINKTNSQTTLF